MAKKKDENKWLQVGNFLLGVEKNTHGQYVVLKTVSGNYTVRWRDDTMMFAMMLNIMRRASEDNNVKEYLHSLDIAVEVFANFGCSVRYRSYRAQERSLVVEGLARVRYKYSRYT